MLDRRWIQAHIPHQAAMCLLDEVVAWDAVRVSCRASSHRASDNPLRWEGRLSAVCGIEYAAQAMAVHGALLAANPVHESTGASRSGKTSAGYLASVRNVTLHAATLDDVATDLIANARLIGSDERTALYDFDLSGAGRILLEGRAAVVFEDFP